MWTLKHVGMNSLPKPWNQEARFNVWAVGVNVFFLNDHDIL